MDSETSRQLSRSVRLSYLVADATGERLTRMTVWPLIATSARRRFTLDEQDRLVELNARGRRVRVQPPVRLNCPSCGRPMFRNHGDSLKESACQSCGDEEISPETLRRSAENIARLQANHARMHAALMAAPRPTEPVEIPPHLLEAFE